MHTASLPSVDQEPLLNCRKSAFNVAVGGWIPCGICFAMIAPFLAKEEDALQVIHPSPAAAPTLCAELSHAMSDRVSCLRNCYADPAVLCHSGALCMTGYLREPCMLAVCHCRNA